MPHARNYILNYIISGFELISVWIGLYLTYYSYLDYDLRGSVALCIAVPFLTSAWCDIVLRCSDCFRADEEEAFEAPLRRAIFAIGTLSQFIGCVSTIFAFWAYNLRRNSACGILVAFGTGSLCELFWQSGKALEAPIRFS
jgi:hypothetical protein